MTLTYQWRDGRFKEFSDVWSNKDYKCRGDMKTALTEHLKKTM